MPRPSLFMTMAAAAHYVAVLIITSAPTMRNLFGIHFQFSIKAPAFVAGSDEVRGGVFSVHAYFSFTVLKIVGFVMEYIYIYI